MLQSWIATPRYVIGGIRRAVIGPWIEELRPLRGATSDQKLVVEITPPVQSWYKIGANERTTATQQSDTTKNGLQFALRAVFPFQSGLLIGQHYALYDLLEQPLVLLIQETSGRWWLLGLDRGLNATIKADTGSETVEQLETLQFDGISATPWLPFSPTQAELIYAASADVVELNNTVDDILNAPNGDINGGVN